MIGALSSERKAAGVMDKEGDNTHTRRITWIEDTDRQAEIRHYPMRLLKAIQARKTKQRGGKVKQRRQVHQSATDKRSESHRSSREEESSGGEKQNRGINR